MQDVLDLPGFPWLSAIVAALAVLFGGGGVVALLRIRLDKKQGIAQQDLDENEAQAQRWKAIIETQTKNLLEPMEKRLEAAERKVVAVQKEVDGLRESLTKRTQMYWSAVNHIRRLYSWIKKHTPEEVSEEVPAPPEPLLRDL